MCASREGKRGWEGEGEGGSVCKSMVDGWGGVL